VGQKLDKFIILGNLISHSEMNLDWNTMVAYLGFLDLDGDDNLHGMSVTGVDYGDNRRNYANNFSWGILDITDQYLTLYDGNEEAGAGLYVRELWVRR